MLYAFPTFSLRFSPHGTKRWTGCVKQVTKHRPDRYIRQQITSPELHLIAQLSLGAKRPFDVLEAKDLSAEDIFRRNFPAPRNLGEIYPDLTGHITCGWDRN